MYLPQVLQQYRLLKIQTIQRSSLPLNKIFPAIRLREIFWKFSNLQVQVCHSCIICNNLQKALKQFNCSLTVRSGTEPHCHSKLIDQMSSLWDKVLPILQPESHWQHHQQCGKFWTAKTNWLRTLWPSSTKAIKVIHPESKIL